jgi:acyl-CoA thioesterase
MSLSELLTAERTGPLAFAARIPDGWAQGRGAFGGIVVGLLARTLATVDGAADRPLRSIQAQLSGPVLSGVATITVEVLRAGTGVSTLAARLVQGGQLQAYAVAMHGRKRVADGTWQRTAAPPLPPWGDVAVVAIGPPLAPVFAPNFEYRPCLGGVPYSGQGDALAGGWVRPKDRKGPRDSAFLTAVIDAWWPAALSTWKAPRPIATIAFTAEVVGSTEGLDPDAPYAYRARADVSDEGYMIEDRELWGVDGRLLALNRQTIAIIV